MEATREVVSTAAGNDKTGVSRYYHRRTINLSYIPHYPRQITVLSTSIDYKVSKYFPK